LSALLLAACSPERTTLEGRIASSTLPRNPALAGEGTAATAQQVRLSALQPDGALVLLDTTDVADDGSYSFETDAGERHLVVEALDENDTVLGAVPVPRTSGFTTTAAPLSPETSVEVQVWLQAVRRTGVRDLIDPNDLRLRVDDDVTGAVVRADAPEVQLTVMADAVRAAQRTESASYLDLGVETSQRARFEATLDAMALHDEMLAAGDEPDVIRDTLRYDFIDATDLPPMARSLSSARAQLALRLLLSERAQAEPDLALEATLTSAEVAALHGRPLLEDRLSGQALDIALVSLGDLEADLRTATSVEDATGAWALHGETLAAGIPDGVLSEAIDVPPDGYVQADLALGQNLLRIDRLLLELVAVAQDTAGPEPGPEELADAIVDVHDGYVDGVRPIVDEQLASLQPEDKALVTDLIVAATRSFRKPPAP